MIEAWRKTWRDGIAPQLSTAGLEALAWALEANDPQLLHGATTEPAAYGTPEAQAPQGGCAIAYALWQGDGLADVALVDEAFARACLQAEEMLGGPGTVNHFLNWWDDGDRAQTRAALLAEVRRALAGQAALAVA